MVRNWIQATFNTKRLKVRLKILKTEKFNEKSKFKISETPLIVENGSFSWGEEQTVLKNINLKVDKGKCFAIVGTVGCGKSSLLSALLGEMDKFTGKVNTVGKIAYVPQQGKLNY